MIDRFTVRELEATLDGAWAEIARLREALEQVEDEGPSWIKAIAREALREKEEWQNDQPTLI
jgi:hypothetical protein